MLAVIFVTINKKKIDQPNDLIPQWVGDAWMLKAQTADHEVAYNYVPIRLCKRMQGITGRLVNLSFITFPFYKRIEV